MTIAQATANAIPEMAVYGESDFDNTPDNAILFSLLKDVMRSKKKKRAVSMTKKSLLHAAKNNSSVEGMCVTLGRDFGEAEDVWMKLIEKAPGAEDFLFRNESVETMREQKLMGNTSALLAARSDFIAATTRLFNNGLIHNRFNNEYVKKIPHTITEQELIRANQDKACQEANTIIQNEKDVVAHSVTDDSAMSCSGLHNLLQSISTICNQNAFQSNDNNIQKCTVKKTKSLKKTFSVDTTKHEPNTVANESKWISNVTRSPINPFRDGSMYGLVFDLLYSHRENGIARRELVEQVMKITGKPEKYCKFNIEVVKMAREDGTGHKSIRHALPVYWVEKGDFGFQLHIR